MATFYELPIPEDIYDFDTITLQEIYEKVQKEFGKHNAVQDKTPQTSQWLRKAQKIMDLASLELEERKMVENFGEMCGNQSYMQLLEQNFNPYVNKEEQKKQVSPVKQQLISPIKQQQMPELTELIHQESKQSLPTAPQTSGSTIDKSLLASQVSRTSQSQKSDLGTCQQS